MVIYNNNTALGSGESGYNTKKHGELLERIHLAAADY